LDKVNWVYSYMKSGRAALFVDRMLRHEARTGVSRFRSWPDFHDVFISEFCLKNELQMALATLETSSYYQGRRSVDEYVDDFRDLIDKAGYKEGLAIVVKFRRGLQRDIQDIIAQLPVGRPDDSDADGWYSAALRCAANQESNRLFHGTPQVATNRPVLTPTIPKRFAPTPPFRPSSESRELAPGSLVKIEKAKAAPGNCYRCKEPGHFAPDCPKRYDIRFMTMDERDEYIQEEVLQQDKEEIDRKVSEDFRNSEE
jgi:hypothetical protein